MHEAALAQDLLTLIAETAHAHSAGAVSRARLELGALSCVSAEALVFAFTALKRGTLADDCELDIVRTPLVVRCPVCCAEGETDPAEPVCSRCGGAPVDVVSGREMRLVSIDVEDERPDA